jgi:hypothetical protein
VLLIRIIFSYPDSDQALTLISDPDSVPDTVFFYNEKDILTANNPHISKKLNFKKLFIYRSGLLMKNTFELQII